MSDKEKIHPSLDEENPMHERMANLPDIPDLPECTCKTIATSHNPAIPLGKTLCSSCTALQDIGITREDFELAGFAVSTFKDRGLLDRSLLERIVAAERELQRSEKRRIESARCSRVYLDENRALKAVLSPSSRFLNVTLLVLEKQGEKHKAINKILKIIKEHEGIPSIEWEETEREILKAAGVLK